MSAKFHTRRAVSVTRHAPGIRTSTIAARWIIAATVLALQFAPAQEALRYSLAGDAAAEARRLRPDSMPFTFKAGEMRVLVTPSLSLDWNDNVKTSRHAEDDFILRPVLGLNVSYPVTQRNLIQLNLAVGYEKYFQHDELSTWYLQSGSELSFDIYVKDFLINLHDRFSYSQDAAVEAAVAGRGDYATVNNTVGVLGTWDLEDLTTSLGYDHANVFSPSDQFQSQAHSSELFSGRAGLRVHPKLTTGLEATAAFTTYDDSILNDNASYSAGVYADWQLGPYFRVQPRAGYTIFQFDNTSKAVPAGILTTSPNVRTRDLNSWYAALTVTHRVTEAISYSLSAGHEVRLGVQSDAIEDWYVRPSIDWNIIKDLSFQTYLTYEHGDAGEGNIQGNLTETYDHFGGGFNLSHPIMSRFTLGLTYRLTVRASSDTSREYTQNLVSLQLTYHPK